MLRTNFLRGHIALMLRKNAQVTNITFFAVPPETAR